MELSATAAFDYPTIAALGDYLSQEAAPNSHQEQHGHETLDVPSSYDYGYGGQSGSGWDGCGDDTAAALSAAAGISGGSGGGCGMSEAEVLAGVRAAVAEALGSSLADDEPLMEVRYLSVVHQVRFRETGDGGEC